jgi:hypothetical protein
MEGFELIRKNLEKALAVKFKVVDITDDFSSDEEKKLFTKMINHLEKLSQHEDKIFDAFKIELSTITEPYWSMLEECLTFAFSTEVKDLIWWYIHDRINAAGDVVAWEDEDGTEYVFKTPGDLYEYILYKFDI